MHWVTRCQIRLDRSACIWLIRRHIDLDATMAYLDAAAIDAAIESGARPFHLTDSEDPEWGDRTSFSLLLAEYRLDQTDPALARLAAIIEGAELQGHDVLPEAAGLWAITAGMRRLAASDQEMVDRMLPIFDALYADCAARVGTNSTMEDAEDSEGAPRV